MSDHLKQNRDIASERLAYARPYLREFGPVGVLTQAGTGQAAEGMGAQSMDTARRP